jgi:hypothetical protein
MTNTEKEIKPELMTINASQLIIDPSYQRQLNKKRAKKIAKNYDPFLENLVKVSFRDNKYYVFDGQHTINMELVRHGYRDVPIKCLVYCGLTHDKEAILFSKQSGFSQKVSLADQLHARYEGHDKEIVDFCEMTKKAGLFIDFTRGVEENKIVALQKAYKIYTADKEIYVKLLRMIKETWNGDPESLRSEILGGVYEFDRAYKGKYDVDKFVEQLSVISPKVIIREGKATISGRDKRYAQQIVNAYNKKKKGGILRVLEL